jgi:hypothetical protein
MVRVSIKAGESQMLMQPGHDGLLQTLLEPCPSLLISVCNRMVQERQAGHLERLVSITTHIDAPCAPTGAMPFLQDDQGSLPLNPEPYSTLNRLYSRCIVWLTPLIGDLLGGDDARVAIKHTDRLHELPPLASAHTHRPAHAFRSLVHCLFLPKSTVPGG